MNILLLTGIQEELYPFLQEHPFEFLKSPRVYRSRKHENLFAATTGPGLKKRKDVRKLLEALQPEIIINGGLVGALSDGDSLQIGDKLKLGTVIKAENRIVFPGGPGRDTLVTVDAPVFEPLEKIHLNLEYEARVCDMEASRLIELVGGMDDLKDVCRIVFCKVCGDVVDSHEVYKHEDWVRGWHKMGLWARIETALRFPGGPMALKKLLYYKTAGIASLTRELHETLNAVLKSGGRTDKLDSTFLPH